MVGQGHEDGAAPQHAENTEVAEFDSQEEEMDLDEFDARASRYSRVNENPEAKEDSKHAYSYKKEEEDAATAAGDAEAEVDNKKEDERGKHFKLFGEVGFAVSNRYGSFSMKFGLQYEN